MTPLQRLHHFGKAKRSLKGLLLFLDLGLITTAWIVACHFVLYPHSLGDAIRASTMVIPILGCIKVFFFIRMGLYRTILRYASIHLATSISKAVTLGSLVSYFIIHFHNQWPLGIFVMDWLMTLVLIGGLRFLPRYYLYAARPEPYRSKKVLIYGVGDLGEAVARRLLSQKNAYLPIGFIDDDPKKQDCKVHNLPVLGNRDDLSSMIKKYNVHEIIVAIARVPSDTLRSLIKECRTHHVFCRIAPSFSDMIRNDVSIKNINISDLLKRDPKDLDEKQIAQSLKGKKILITGAAGSIGSELARQALRFKPSKLILVDRTEFSLYHLENEFRENREDVQNLPHLRFVLQDIGQTDSIEFLIGTEKPDIIFHAAAYKHVPLLEENPFSGVFNNIAGTISVANAADRHRVKKFVLISTDKAVRPTSVMGASKRICELYIQNLNLHSQTEYVAVRFGNVLGSSGSVVPRFLNQIKNGGPVTVSHPEVTRFFMLVQEAVQLVMQAASIGHGGEIFILNMGSPIRIKEMAEDLIFLAGKEPYKDINILFTGLRHGEKLFEEILINDMEKKTQYENITIGKTTLVEWEKLMAHIQEILVATKEENKQKLLIAIKELVPEFNHSNLPLYQMFSEKIVSLPV